jgi:predicted PurR-regulated permease PerM
MTTPASPVRPPANGPPLRFDLVNVALATAVALTVYEAFRFLGAIESVLILLVISLILATAIDPLVTWLRGLGFQQRYGVLMIYLVVVTAVSIFLVFLVRLLIVEFLALITALPPGLRRLNAQVSGLPPGPLRDTAVAAVGAVSEAFGRSASSTIVNSGTLSGLFQATLTVFEAVFATVTVMVLAYFWLSERPTVRRWVGCLVPERHRDTVLIVWETVEDRLGAWSRGQLLLMIVVATIQGIGYTILGLPFAPLLATWAGLCELIPMVGPYIGAAPALLIALAHSPLQALLVAVFALVVNLIEANILVPRIMGRAVGLSPLTVIIALLAGTAVYGIIGALVAVPIAAGIQAAIEELVYIRSLER